MGNPTSPFGAGMTPDPLPLDDGPLPEVVWQGRFGPVRFSSEMMEDLRASASVLGEPFVDVEFRRCFDMEPDCDVPTVVEPPP